MRTIWKFPLYVAEEQFVNMPQIASILTIQMQDGEPYLWATVDPSAPTAKRLIVCHGTGHTISETGLYIGTVQQGSFVWHFFDNGWH